MFGPLFPVNFAFQRTTTRSTWCYTVEERTVEERLFDEESGRDPEATLERLDAELQSWLNHPSNSTWTGPRKNID